MDEYYDYAQEKYVKGDPMLNLYTHLMGIELMKRKAREHAKEREEREARLREEDHTRTYKVLIHNDIQYIRKFLKDSLKKADTWSDRLKLYNDLFVDYLKRKSYVYILYQKPELYALSLNEYKEVVKYEQSLEAK